MSQSPHPIDDLLRRRLYDAEVPPPAFVWAGVEQALQRRRRRRWLFFWLLLGTLGAGGAGWFAVNRDSNPAATAARRPVETHTTTAANTTGRTDGVAANSALTNVTPTGTSAAAAEKAAPSGPKAASRAPASTGTAAAAPTRISSATALPRTPTDLRAAPAPHEPGPVVVAQETPKPLAFLTPRRASTVVSNRRTALLPARASALRTVASAPASAGSTPAPALAEAATPADKPVAAARKRPGSRRCYDFSKNPSAWVVEAYAGPSFEHKTMTPLADSFTAYRDARLATESPDWAYNGGVRLTRIFSRNFVLRTGLHYEQVVERFKHVELNVKRTEEYRDPWTGEITTVVNRYDVYRHIYNRFGWLDIPLQVGMELRAGRAGLSLHTGATFNLVFWKRGRILTPSGTRPISLASGDANFPDVFRGNVGVSMMSNLQCFYHLSARDRIFLEPYFRQILRPVTADAFPVTQRYSFWGLQAGFSHILK